VMRFHKGRDFLRSKVSKDVADGAVWFDCRIGESSCAFLQMFNTMPIFCINILNF
jgi:hypothetical protein